MLIRTITAVGVVALACSTADPAHASDYPTRPIKLIVPFTPGGSNDVLARVLAEKLAVSLGQSVLVDNKPGASGNIGADFVAKAAPDGHTLLIAANNIMSMNPGMFRKMSFDTLKDFDPITMLGTVPVLLVAGPSLKVSNVQELIAKARQQPDGLNYASSGIGSPQHLSAELFKSMTQTKIAHIPYRGAGPAITDLLGGQVSMQFGALNSLLPHVRSGHLKAIAVGGSRRVSTLPDVPTVAESGVPGFESDIWVALVAPAKTPRAIVERLNREVREIMAQPDVKQKLAEQAITGQTSTPDELTKVISSDLLRWSQVIKDAGIVAD